jgi:hypothetical protein
MVYFLMPHSEKSITMKRSLSGLQSIQDNWFINGAEKSYSSGTQTVIDNQN